MKLRHNHRYADYTRTLLQSPGVLILLQVHFCAMLVFTSVDWTRERMTVTFGTNVSVLISYDEKYSSE